MITDRIAHGALIPRHRGVFAVGHAAEVEWGRQAAALLAVGFDAVLTYRAAGLGHGILPADTATDPVDVTTPRSGVRGHAGIRLHRSRGLAAKDVTTVHGLPVTTAARTLLDLADVLSERELERALDEALAKRLTSPTKVREVLKRAGRGRRGASILAALLRRTTSSVTRSEAEERLLATLRLAGVEEPDCNVDVHGVVPDCYWARAALAANFDSKQWHRSPAARRRDTRQRATLRAHGIDVVTILWEQLTDEPLALVADLQRRITERTLARAAA
jgi:hypothetical protein